jgi:hypothetical protein
MKSRSVLGGLRSNNPKVSRTGYMGGATQGRVQRGPANTVGRFQRGGGGRAQRNSQYGRMR